MSMLCSRPLVALFEVQAGAHTIRSLRLLALRQAPASWVLGRARTMNCTQGKLQAPTVRVSAHLLVAHGARGGEGHVDLPHVASIVQHHLGQLKPAVGP